MNKSWLQEHQFEEVQLSDYDLYNTHIRNSNYFTGLWASNFTYIWSLSQLSFIKVYRKIIDNMLVTFILTKRKFMYVWCLPFGEGSSKNVLRVTKKSLLLCKEWNTLHGHQKAPSVYLLNERQLEFLSITKSFKGIFKVKQAKRMEYLWSIEKLLHLKGKEFRSIRWARNKLLREHPTIHFRKFNPKDYRDIQKIKNVWNRTSGQKYKSITDSNLLKQVLHHYQELNELIFVATIENKIVGFVTGAILPNGLAWGCVGKALPDYKGIYEFLYLEFIKAIHEMNPTITHLHVGSDNNQEGLRNFKEKFRPVEKLKLYTIKLQ